MKMNKIASRINFQQIYKNLEFEKSNVLKILQRCLTYMNNNEQPNKIIKELNYIEESIILYSRSVERLLNNYNRKEEKDDDTTLNFDNLLLNM